MTTPYGVRPGELTGTATFRMLPTDDFAVGPSSVTISPVAEDRALSMAYTWTHPEDGEHAGLLLLGAPGEDGVVAAAWIDAWHQQTVASLTGTTTDTGALVTYEYAPGWRWEIELEVSQGRPGLVMRNVVPDRDDEPGVTYDVTRTDWS